MKITEIWKKNKQNIVPLGICSLYLFILLVFLKDTICFQSDDSAIVMILKEGFDGISHPNAIFLSPLLSKTLYSLYKLKPTIPWYFITLYTSQFIGLFLGIKLINNSTKTIFLKTMLILSFLALTFFIFIRVNFASTSLFLFFMSTIYLSYRNSNYTKCGYQDYFLGLSLVTSYLIRPDILKVGLIVALPLFLIFIFKKQQRMKIAVTLVAVLPILLLSSFIGQTKDFSNQIISDYRHFQHERSILLDTNVGTYNKYIENSLTSSELSKSDYYMLKNWWTFDNSIYTLEKMKSIVGDNFTLKNLISINLGIKNTSGTLLYLLLTLLTMLLLFSNKDKFVLLNSKMNNDRIKIYFTFFYTISCTLLLSFIRFPPRVSAPVFTYLFFLIIFIFLISPKLVKLKGSPISLVLLAFLIFSISISQLYVTVIVDKHLSLKKQYSYQSFKKCTTNFKKVSTFIYLNNHSTKLNPFTEDFNYLNQMIIPGGWLINTPYYFEFLKKYNYSSGNDLCRKMINNEKILICFWDKSKKNISRFPLMETHVEKHFNDNYGKFFENHISIKIVLDNRYINKYGDTEGLVFFTLVSE